ncbi:MAG: isochorismatase family protein [Thermofilaceae archaeon]
MIIVVDMQNDFVKPGGKLVVSTAAATVEPIRQLLARARAKGVRIFYTQDTHYEGDLEFSMG